MTSAHGNNTCVPHTPRGDKSSLRWKDSENVPACASCHDDVRLAAAGLTSYMRQVAYSSITEGYMLQIPSALLEHHLYSHILEQQAGETTVGKLLA